jgi:probable HAF family extracellular repeat protein
MRLQLRFLTALLMTWGGGLRADVMYSVTDLGTLGGSFTTGYGLNNSGQVVGGATTSPNDPLTQHAFLYSNGQMTDLGVLPGYGRSQANGINDAGQVVGSASSSFVPIVHSCTAMVK